MSTIAESLARGSGAAAPGFAIVTVGCEKNEVDSDRMRTRLLAAGYREVDDPAEADVCLVNTCGFLAEATGESIEAVLWAAEEEPAVVMCGCVPSRYGAELAAELPEVDAFLGVDEEDRVVEVVEGLVGAASAPSEGPSGRELDEPFDPRACRTLGSSVAFVKIAEGCSRRCSFCAIPLIRGPLRSREADDIIAEARALAEGGAREIVLIAQDTSAWGRDLPGRPSLASLLWLLSEALLDLGTWIRVLYVQPEGVDDELICAIASAPGIVPYLDLPLQHVSRRLLASMGRTGDCESFTRLVETLRARIPGLTLRTTVICGYPDETDEEHRQLLDFLAEAAFDYVAVFPFSAEEGTRAATLPGQIDEEVKLARTQAVRDLTEEIGFKRAAERVGGVVEAIIDAETPDDADGAFVAHGAFQAPETDGVIHLAGEGLAVGERVRLELTDAWCFDFEGEVRHG